MIFKKTTVIERDDLLFANVILNDELDLAMYRYKNKRQNNCEPRRFLS